MSIHPRAVLLALMPLLCALPLAAGAATVTLADIGLVTDDNITAARNGSPRRQEQALQLGIAQVLSAAVDRGISLRLVARADGRFYRQQQGLNELGAGLDGQLLLRPAPAFTPPRWGSAWALAPSSLQAGCAMRRKPVAGCLCSRR